MLWASPQKTLLDLGLGLFASPAQNQSVLLVQWEVAHLHAARIRTWLACGGRRARDSRLATRDSRLATRDSRLGRRRLRFALGLALWQLVSPRQGATSGSQAKTLVRDLCLDKVLQQGARREGGSLATRRLTASSNNWEGFRCRKAGGAACPEFGLAHLFSGPT